MFNGSTTEGAMNNLSDFDLVVFTWGDEIGGSCFYGIGKYFAAEQWRMIGDDKVSVVIERTPKAQKLLQLLSTIDFSDALVGDRWILVGRIIDTPLRLRRSGCEANKVLLVDIDKTTKALMDAISA